jgi:glycine dehydrogenase subunit 2
MFEPTETETPEALDAACDLLLDILKRAEKTPEEVRAAPLTTVIGRPDETTAARRPVVRYN